MPLDPPAVPRNGDYGESLRKVNRGAPLPRPTTGATGPRAGVVPPANAKMRRPVPPIGAHTPMIPPLTNTPSALAPANALPAWFQSHPLNGVMPGPTAMRASPQQMGPDAAMIGGTNAGAGQLPYGNHGFTPAVAAHPLDAAINHLMQQRAASSTPSATPNLSGPLPGSQLLPMTPGMNTAPTPIPLAPPGNTFQSGQGRQLLQGPSPQMQARNSLLQRNIGPHGYGGLGVNSGLSAETIAGINGDVAANNLQQARNNYTASEKKQMALKDISASRSQSTATPPIPKPLTRQGPEGEQLYLPNKREGVRPRFVEGQKTVAGSQVVRTPTGGLALIGNHLAGSDNKTPEGAAATLAKAQANQAARDRAFGETKAGINAKASAREHADALIMRNARLYGLKPETTPAVKDAMDRKLAREAGFGGSPGGFNKMIEEGNKFANSEHGKRVADIYKNGGVSELAKHYNTVEQHMDKDELKRFQNWMLTDPEFSKDTSTAAQTIRDTVAKRIGGAKAVAAKVPTAPPTNAVASFQQSVLRGGKPVGEGTEQPLYPGRFGGY